MNYSLIRLISILSIFAVISHRAHAMVYPILPVKSLKNLVLEERVRQICAAAKANNHSVEEMQSIIGSIQQMHAPLLPELKTYIANTLVKRWANKTYTSHQGINTYYDGRQLSLKQRKLYPTLGADFSPWLQLSFDELIAHYITVHQAKKNKSPYPYQLIIPAAQEQPKICSVFPQYNAPEMPNFDTL